MAEIICAGHAIKEVLTANECLSAMEDGVRRAGATLAGSFIISDGGDGFLEACEAFGDVIRHEIPCTGPLGDELVAPILYDEGNRVAYIEMAQSSGLRLVEPERRKVLMSGTAGLADLVAAARDLGAKKIYVGLGGSATCDGGIGFLWRLSDISSRVDAISSELRVAIDLPDMPSPDLLAIRKWLGDIELIACVDVNNSLLGENGAARVFAPQKGADEQETEQLDAWMREWCERIQRNVGVAVCDVPGSGAAGGLGFAFLALDAELKSGAETVCKLSGLTDTIRKGHLVVTAEGKFDQTSMSGKAPWVAATTALEKGAAALVLCGSADADAAKRAGEAGVTVREYGRDLPVDQRVEKSPGLISETLRSTICTAAENAE